MHSYQLQCFLSSCKRVIAFQAQKKTSIAKRRRRRNSNWSGGGKKLFRRRVAKESEGERTERGRNMQNNVCGVRNPNEYKRNKTRAATLCLVQWWWGLHMISGETFWSFGHLLLTNAKKKATSVRQLEKKQKRSPLKKNTTSRQCFSKKPRLHSPRSA